jgi:CarD family transcriptional regulator
MSAIQFRIGELAVYPAQGVAEVIGIETRRIGALQEIFYTLRIIDSEKKIMIPVKKVESVGLRKVISAEEVDELLTMMATPAERSDVGETWNRRYRRYLEKIKSGKALEVSEVFRDLCQIKLTKELSFGERKMLDVARTLLVTEFSIASGTDEGEMDIRLDALFGLPEAAEEGTPEVEAAES